MYAVKRATKIILRNYNSITLAKNELRICDCRWKIYILINKEWEIKLCRLHTIHRYKRDMDNAFLYN